MNQLAEKTEKLYFIDLFAGAGGLSEGFIGICEEENEHEI